MYAYTSEIFNSNYATNLLKGYQWYTNPTNKSLFDKEHTFLQHLLAPIKKDSACCIGFSEPNPHLLTLNTKQTIALGSFFFHSNALYSDIYYWPIQTGSIQLVLLHHVLEWSTHPLRILREANRVLEPGGIIVIITFNPISLLSLYRFIRPSFSPPFKKSKLYCARSIYSWLRILGFSCIKRKYALGHYTMESERLNTVLNHCKIGSVSSIIAIKEQPGFLFESPLSSCKNEVPNAFYACSFEKNHFIKLRD